MIGDKVIKGTCTQDHYKDGYIILDGESYLSDINDFIDSSSCVWKNKSNEILNSKEFLTPKRNLCIEGWFIFRIWIKWR